MGPSSTSPSTSPRGCNGTKGVELRKDGVMGRRGDDRRTEGRRAIRAGGTGESRADTSWRSVQAAERRFRRKSGGRAPLDLQDSGRGFFKLHAHIREGLELRALVHNCLVLRVRRHCSSDLSLRRGPALNRPSRFQQDRPRLEDEEQRQAQGSRRPCLSRTRGSRPYRL